MKEDNQLFENRKKEHIKYSLAESCQSKKQESLYSELLHDPLPNFNFSDIAISTYSLGKKRATPFFVSSMTAGHEKSKDLNLLLARVCQKKGWAFAVGSQRKQLFDVNAAKEWLELVDEFPELEIFANLGIAQVIESTKDQIVSVLDSLNASAFIIHLNPLQEVIQAEGTTHFKGSLEAISQIKQELNIPVIVKETGCGFSLRSLAKLSELNVDVVDLAGQGGTHWGLIEGERSKDNVEESWRYEVAQTFSQWGQSSQWCLEQAHLNNLNFSFETWSSGGIRDGKTAAHMIGLGAKRVGLAQPILKAALEGEKNLENFMARIEYELKAAMFCTNSVNLENLKQAINWK